MASRTYTVKPGDSLYQIARRYTTEREGWLHLWTRNSRIIGRNPDLIHPDQVLFIPDSWPDHDDFTYLSLVDLRPLLQGVPAHV